MYNCHVLVNKPSFIMITSQNLLGRFKLDMEGRDVDNNQRSIDIKLINLYTFLQRNSPPAATV